MIHKLAIAGVILLLVLGAAGVVVLKIRADAVAVERAKVAAKANQNIAERRAKDAKFDKMDAQQHCLADDLEWVFENGRSFCR